MNQLLIQALIDTAFDIAFNALHAASVANATLKQAQAEAWTNDDPRWAGPFQDVDQALSEAEKSLQERATTGGG